MTLSAKEKSALRPTPHALPVVSAERTRVYGLWCVVVRGEDGQEYEGWALSEQEARYLADLRARRADELHLAFHRPANADVEDSAENGDRQ